MGRQCSRAAPRCRKCGIPEGIRRIHRRVWQDVLYGQGYDVCHNSEEAAARIGYDPDMDVENTADSVFCSHGAGIIVPWYEVEEHMHVESGVRETPSGQELACSGYQTGKAYDRADAG